MPQHEDSTIPTLDQTLAGLDLDINSATIIHDTNAELRTALRTVLTRLEALDKTEETRRGFAGSILTQQMLGADSPAFSYETGLIREALGLPPKSEEKTECEPEPATPVATTEERPAFDLDDL